MKLKLFLLGLLLFLDIPATAQIATMCLPDPTQPWCLSGTYIKPSDSTRKVSIGDLITAGSGTGITVNDVGSLERTIYKITIGKTAFVTAGVTSDVTVATLPAKMRLVGVIGDLTQVFACTATCTSSTLSFVFGKSAGGNEYLVSFDADASTAVFGDADGELGTSINAAGAIQGGDLASWASTTALKLRLTSGTGNIGTGTVTNLSQGSLTLYLTVEQFP